MKLKNIDFIRRVSMGLVCLLSSVFVVEAQADTVAQFRLFSASTGAPLLFGDLDVRLFNADRPVTVGNFIGYVERGDFQNMFLHRALPGFIVQGGGYLAGSVFDASVFGPPYSNIGLVAKQEPIVNEYDGDPRFSNVFGTIAMAKTPGDPNSATSEWFFNLNNNASNLDGQNGGFTVFGELARGAETLNLFNALSKGNNLVDLRDTHGQDDPVAARFPDLPTFASGTEAPPYNELIFVQINLLKLQSIQINAEGLPVLEWQSIDGVPNIVEYSEDGGATWETAHTADGTGGSLSFTDANAASSARIYRIRIDYAP